MTDRILTAARLPSPLGDLHVVSDGDTLIALDFDGYEARMTGLLRRRFPNAVLKQGKAPAVIAGAMARYFKGDLAAVDALDVETGGTDFQRAVWAALRRIPAGETRAYGDLAAQLGKPSAMRAVGLANGSNAIAIVVPCHRVIGANGSLTGYAGGLERKRFLLRHEAAASGR
ncbi:MAG: methylated-DNA--[protein]-cysteine S-methyltransferase [Alphaproteobacteria bacterium]|nr:methylated-DNA--[protein]-cysteine S-methyltransferase [Alphaproteobacteria bacterium]